LLAVILKYMREADPQTARTIVYRPIEETAAEHKLLKERVHPVSSASAVRPRPAGWWNGDES